MLKKRFEKTEILDEDFLEKLDEEIHKKYPYNTKNSDNTNNIDSKDDDIEILEDTAELLLMSFIEETDNLKKELKENDSSNNKSLDDTIELLNAQINIISNPSNTLEDTIEFLNSDVSFLKQNEDIELLDEEIDNFDVPSKDLENTTQLLDIELRTDPIVVRKKITPKKKPWIILLSVCTCVIILTIYKLFFWQQDSIKTNEQIKNVLKDTKTNDVIIKDNIASGSVTDSDSYFNYLDVDFTNLLKQNDEVKGWIKVKNTNINYPFVQTSDNEFYLKHSLDKSRNSAGWVFADFRNDFSYLDQNTILYAHGRLDNTMFGSLKKVVNESWYSNKENRFVQISTIDSKMIFEVFSVYTIKPETYYITPNFNNDTQFDKFINTLISRSIYDFNIELNTNDKILTLSSCYNDELRVVLHAKLVNIIQS